MCIDCPTLGNRIQLQGSNTHDFVWSVSVTALLGCGCVYLKCDICLWWYIKWRIYPISGTFIHHKKPSKSNLFCVDVYVEWYAESNEHSTTHAQQPLFWIFAILLCFQEYSVMNIETRFSDERWFFLRLRFLSIPKMVFIATIFVAHANPHTDTHTNAKAHTNAYYLRANVSS